MDRKTRMHYEDAVEEMLEQLEALCYERLGDLSCTAYITKEPVPFAQRTSGTQKQLKEGDVWAEEVFDCAWMHITGELPSIAQEELVFLINCGGEGLICDSYGTEKQSITCYASDFSPELGKPEKKVVLSEGLVVDGKVDFWIDAAANDLFGKMKEDSRFALLCCARQQTEIRNLFYDVQLLYGVYTMNDDGAWETQILEALNAIAGEIQSLTEQAAKVHRAALAPFLAEKNEGEVFHYSAMGHAHLDLAWLWPIRESKRKGARTFATQLMNIKRYPDYVFGASQAQLYDWVKESYPALYARVKEAAKGKNWDVQGATWVEMDSNLISGESMMRQFFYGKQFMQEEFGQEMKIFWVPDSFGYSACIPQVMALANVPYFLTQKMSWNTVNKFPHHSFWWQGLDGTKVLAHMLPESTYNSPVRPDYLTMGEENYMEREISSHAMQLFGIGDGGAGPGFEHIERALRLADLKGMPKVKMEKSMDFFKAFDDGKTPYPTHSGELYLERHRGTYTTQSKNKKYNRKCEFALRNYELLASLALKNGLELPISKEELDIIWKEVLLYQFHDILPGSSINRVYVESVARYESLLAQLEQGIERLLLQLVGGETAVNLNAFPYSKTLSYGGTWYRCSIPALGFTKITAGEALSAFAAKADENSIENDKLRVVFAQGCIVSLFDKTLNREFVAEGGTMALLTEYPDEGDCWDIKPTDYYQRDKTDAVCTSFLTGTNGAEAYAQAEYTVGASKVVQRFTLTDGSALLEGDLDIDCKQENAMLRIAFPTALQTGVCNFNIQFGHLARATTEHNSVEQAQFEVSGQKFVDLSEQSCGLALLNDCKYGYRCKGGLMDMDLIRSPKGGPGSAVDQGKHSVRYALLPHAGELGAEVYHEAYLLNNPLRVVEGKAACGAQAQSLFCCENPNIVLESVKIPEDGKGLMARVYNAGSKPVTAKIGFSGYTVQGKADIMENPLEEVAEDTVTLPGFGLCNLRLIDK